MYEQNYLRSSINFAMSKVKLGRLTARTVKIMYKEKLKSLMQVAMHLCSPGGLVYWQKFLYEVLAIVKKLGILMYFLTLSCTDLS